MKNMKKTVLLISISFCIAVPLCLVQLIYYFELMLGTDKGEQSGYAEYSLQHESNPLDKEMQCFSDLYEKLVSNQRDDYEYYEIYTQYLENTKEERSFYSVSTEELEESCSAIKCIQLSENVFRDWDIRVEQGDLLHSADYIYEKDEAIPILLGSAYFGLYTVGDTFTLQYLFDEYDLKVAGILVEGSRVGLRNDAISLDKYIIMPSFTIAENVPATNGLKIHYANKTSGVVQLEMEKTDFFYSLIVPLLSSANVGEYSWTVQPMSLQFKEIFGFGIGTFRIIIYTICVLMVLLNGILVIRLAKLREVYPNVRGNLKNAWCGIILFVLASVIYVFVNYIYIVFLGITVMKSIYFVIIGAASAVVAFVLRRKEH